MKAPEQRLREQTIVIESGCWEWTGWLDSDGYGRISRALLVRHGLSCLAHRAMYECVVGPIPDDLTLDHLCRNRACVNPAHLEPVTLTENVRRGTSFAVTNRAKTHCANDHEFTVANTYIRPSGFRDCRACVNERQRRYQARKRREAA